LEFSDLLSFCSSVTASLPVRSSAFFFFSGQVGGGFHQKINKPGFFGVARETDIEVQINSGCGYSAFFSSVTFVFSHSSG